MSEFVKRTALGYRPASGGYSDPECSHVVLTKEEYDRMLREKSQAEQEKRNAEYEAERTARRAQDVALIQIRKAEEAANQYVENIKHELAAEKAESTYQRRLNENLLRISKERANADSIVCGKGNPISRRKSALENRDALGDGAAKPVFGGFHRGTGKKTNAG